MPNTFNPTQIGYIPTGANGVTSISSISIGKLVSGVFEGAGYGQNGRPDPVQVVQINMADPVGDGTYIQRGSVTFNVDDLSSLKAANASVPSNLNLTFREVSVCQNSTNKKMIILASAPY